VPVPEAEDPLLIALLGPTAGGKTTLSLALAERFNGEIVSCDSVALYREFDIGTAKPTPAERDRAPHHMIDIANPTETVTAGDYARRARASIEEIRARQKTPIVVGGTGLYLRALLDGLFAGPQRSEPLRDRLRERSEAKGPAHLHKILNRLDPAAAAKIHANDVPKTIRAIELCLSARTPMTQLWNETRTPLTGFRILKLSLNPERENLYARINQRCQQMFDQGLVEETKALLEKYGPSPWPLQSLGYKQATQHLRGELTRQQAIEAAQQAHRNYAKRQITWFRREPHVHWLPGFGDQPDTIHRAFSEVDVLTRNCHPDQREGSAPA
jgi:tRNA dimethylallyltransferase